MDYGFWLIAANCDSDSSLCNLHGAILQVLHDEDLVSSPSGRSFLYECHLHIIPWDRFRLRHPLSIQDFRCSFFCFFHFFFPPIPYDMYDYGISMETWHDKIAGDSSQNKNTALPVLANKKRKGASYCAPSGRFLLVCVKSPVFVLRLFVPLIGMNPGPKVHIRSGHPV